MDIGILSIVLTTAIAILSTVVFSTNKTGSRFFKIRSWFARSQVAILVFALLLSCGISIFQYVHVKDEQLQQHDELVQKLNQQYIHMENLLSNADSSSRSLQLVLNDQKNIFEAQIEMNLEQENLLRLDSAIQNNVATSIDHNISLLTETYSLKDSTERLLEELRQTQVAMSKMLSPIETLGISFDVQFNAHPEFLELLEQKLIQIFKTNSNSRSMFRYVALGYERRPFELQALDNHWGFGKGIIEYDSLATEKVKITHAEFPNYWIRGDDADSSYSVFPKEHRSFPDHIHAQLAFFSLSYHYNLIVKKENDFRYLFEPSSFRPGGMIAVDFAHNKVRLINQKTLLSLTADSTSRVSQFSHYDLNDHELHLWFYSSLYGIADPHPTIDSVLSARLVYGSNLSQSVALETLRIEQRQPTVIFRRPKIPLK